MLSHQYHFSMELRQLRYLVALARELSFTEAARVSNVAQPALSRQIRKLEDELGTALVDRTSRRVQMTAAGRLLAERAIQILDEVEAARHEITDVVDLAGGSLSVGMTQTPGPLDVGRLLADFHRLYPAIELTVREELSIVVAEQLRQDRVELGIVSEIPESARRGLEMTLIAAEPLVIALPPRHHLAQRGEVAFAEVASEPFILFPEGATIRGTFETIAAAHGVTPTIAFVTSDTDRMRELVELGLGVGLLPESDAQRPDSGHATVRLRGESLTYRVYLARRRTRRQSTAALAMASLVSQALATPLASAG